MQNKKAVPSAPASYARTRTGKTFHYANILRNTEIFNTFSNKDVLELFAYIEELKIAPDENIFRQDSAADCMYFIISGEVVIEKGAHNNQERVAQYTDGEFFGETGLFLGMERGVNARTLDATLLLRFPASNISWEDILHTNSALYILVLETLVAHVASRIRSINNLIAQNSHWVNVLREQLFFDKITALYTLKFYKEEFVKRIDEKSRVVAVMIKPRNFKRINDTYGHDVGDAVLHKMGITFLTIVKEQGYVIRYLGNEFALVSKTISMERALRLAEEIMRQLEATDLRFLGVENDTKLVLMKHAVQYPDEHDDPSSLLDYGHQTFMEVFTRVP